MPKPQSPPITEIHWGQIIVAGHKPFKDAKLYPGGARAWDWRETGTSHEPGIQPADVAELLENGAQVVILGTGFQERLRVQPETLAILDEAGVQTHVRPTEEAARLYNELRERTAVAALIHSNC